MEIKTELLALIPDLNPSLEGGHLNQVNVLIKMHFIKINSNFNNCAISMGSVSPEHT